MPDRDLRCAGDTTKITMSGWNRCIYNRYGTDNIQANSIMFESQHTHTYIYIYMSSKVQSKMMIHLYSLSICTYLQYIHLYIYVFIYVFMYIYTPRLPKTRSTCCLTGWPGSPHGSSAAPKRSAAWLAENAATIQRSGRVNDAVNHGKTIGKR